MSKGPRLFGRRAEIARLQAEFAREAHGWPPAAPQAEAEQQKAEKPRVRVKASSTPAPVVDMAERMPAAELAEACEQRGVLFAASTFIRLGWSRADFLGFLDWLDDFQGMSAAAGRVNPEAALDDATMRSMVIQRTPLAEVRAAIFDRLVDAQSPDVVNAHGGGYRPGDHGWGAAVRRAGDGTGR